jgi:predicted HD phosphohydrolase
MDQGTDEDFRILKRVHEDTLGQLPDRLFSMLKDLSGDQAYNLNRLEHSLQSATRALRDGAEEELIVVALFHDVGEALGPMNHDEIAAAILHPFISDDNYNMLKFHDLFQDLLLRGSFRPGPQRSRQIYGSAVVSENS